MTNSILVVGGLVAALIFLGLLALAHFFRGRDRSAQDALKAENERLRQTECLGLEQTAKLEAQLSELKTGLESQSAALGDAMTRVAQSDEKKTHLEEELAGATAITDALQLKLNAERRETDRLRQGLCEAVSDMNDISQKMLAMAEAHGSTLKQLASGRFVPEGTEDSALFRMVSGAPAEESGEEEADGQIADLGDTSGNVAAAADKEPEKAELLLH
jgi:hypothetical protein